MNQNLTRREMLIGMASVSLLQGTTHSKNPPSQAQNASPICFMSTVELARLIQAKKLSAREVLAAHLDQIDRINPKVNALVTLVPRDKVEAAAAKADEMQARKEKLGLLHGLPVAHKDLIATKDIRTTYGSPIYRDNIPKEDDLVVERMRRAGAIIVGKSNAPEFGSGSQTFNKVFGATYNPYDLRKTCGGSSGGAAVALACGLVPVATGGDTGGSLRNPAAFCNVVGFRPSIGRVPNPKNLLPWLTLTTNGCLGRSVADLAFSLSTIAGPDPRVPLSISESGTLFSQPLGRNFKGVRVAWFRDLGGNVPFDPRVRAIVDGHRKTFETLGCIVEEAEPDFKQADTAFRVLRAWNTAYSYNKLLSEHPNDFKDTLRQEIEEGLRLTAMDVADAQNKQGQLWRSFQEFLQRYEYFVLPTTQLPPFDVKLEYPTEIAGTRFNSYIDWMKSCWYISATGNPAASVPAGFTGDGLPVGLQIVGRNKEDFSVLQMANAFEEMTGFGKKHPTL